jgi:hypothetical protein
MATCRLKKNYPSQTKRGKRHLEISVTITFIDIPLVELLMRLGFSRLTAEIAIELKWPPVASTHKKNRNQIIETRENF